MSTRARALIIGCHGGVGRALLGLLRDSGPGARLRDRCDALFLLDRVAGEPPLLDGATLLPPQPIEQAADLVRLISDHGLTHVVDVSSLDTTECTRACDDLGVHYLCTSVEEWPGRGSIPTDAAISRLLPPRRPALTRAGHLVGSGANPGIVNALVPCAIREMARRAGVAPTLEALDLHAILITEEDTTRPSGGGDSTDVFAMTWSPQHCLEELFEARAFAARDGRVVDLGHRPTAALYEARCGDRIIRGMAVPHEELVTLGTRYRDVEIAFIYRLPRQARRALAAHPARTRPDGWRTRRLYPPWTDALEGRDRVGVLLCSRRFGELWMGFDTPVSAGLRYGTNATQLQVAAGVLAGWSQLGNLRGIHFVEDLDTDRFVRVASEILGPPGVVHDPEARPVSLTDRVVPLAVAV
ncbi:MAG TPA: hypothetical protein VIL35_12565 [Vicinamibacterales bacterium]